MFQGIVVAQEGAASAALGLIPLCVMLAAIVPMIAGWWKIFEKAGKPGWAAIIPIYNFWVMVEISSKEVLWFVLMLVPVINIIAAFVVTIDVAEKFGKGALYGVSMVIFPFCIVTVPMLGFGDARFRG